MKVTMIVFDSVWYDPRVRREAISCVQNGIEVTVLGIKDKEYNEEKVAALPFKTILIDYMANDDDQTGRTVFSILKRMYSSYNKLIQACIKTSPDVIHANDLDTLPVAYFAAKKTKSKIVYDSHEIYTENIGIVDNWMKRIFWCVVERLLISRVNQVISVSHSSASVLATMYNIEKPLVITNCAFRSDASILKAKRRDKFEVLYHGRFYHGRGYDEFVRASVLMKNYSDIQFVLRGHGSIEGDLRKIAAENNLDGTLRFDPPVDVAELIQKASESHVGVVISEAINKNFVNTVSNKLFEYITAGLPVLLSDGPEHRYLNEKYHFGIILQNNTAQCIAHNIELLYSNPYLCSELCANAEKMAQILNWESEAEKLINVYKRLTK